MGIHLARAFVEAARTGDRTDVERLIEAVWPDAYRLAYAVLGDQHAAEDAAQEACLVIYRTIPSLRAPSAFAVWFYRIVVRVATASKRDRARVELCDADMQARDADTASAIDIWRALERLSPKLRTVVVLRYFEQLSSREIASILRIPDGTVRFRLMTAKQRLRPLLDDPSQPLSANHEVHPHAI
ncbi:MAG TPA: RNA polymerase sigma factor [Candidatus Acidoferrum sp.]|nr:RNA polymerase sigma factor [Candidatus Acidoferrum sp.]